MHISYAARNLHIAVLIIVHQPQTKEMHGTCSSSFSRRDVGRFTGPIAKHQLCAIFLLQITSAVLCVYETRVTLKYFVDNQLCPIPADTCHTLNVLRMIC